MNRKSREMRAEGCVRVGAVVVPVGKACLSTERTKENSAKSTAEKRYRSDKMLRDSEYRTWFHKVSNPLQEAQKLKTHKMPEINVLIVS